MVISGVAPVDDECASLVGKAQVYSEGSDVWDCMLNQVSFHQHILLQTEVLLIVFLFYVYFTVIKRKIVKLIFLRYFVEYLLFCNKMNGHCRG